MDALRQLTSCSKLKENATEPLTGEEILKIDVDGAFRTPVTSALTIQTSPVPSTSSYSTDTASESGSAFNSPTNQAPPAGSDPLASSSYVKDFSRLVVVKVINREYKDNSANGKFIH